jgi:hypothetical protein
LAEILAWETSRNEIDMGKTIDCPNVVEDLDLGELSLKDALSRLVDLAEQRGLVPTSV